MKANETVEDIHSQFKKRSGIIHETFAKQTKSLAQLTEISLTILAETKDANSLKLE